MEVSTSRYETQDNDRWYQCSLHYYQGIWKSMGPGKTCKVGGLVMAGKSVQLLLLKNDQRGNSHRKAQTYIWKLQEGGVRRTENQKGKH